MDKFNVEYNIFREKLNPKREGTYAKENPIIVSKRRQRKTRE